MHALVGDPLPELPMSIPIPSSRWWLLAIGLACAASACDRRAEGVEGDLSPETGITTPTPQETPPSDPPSGAATTPPDDTAEPVAPR